MPDKDPDSKEDKGLFTGVNIISIIIGILIGRIFIVWAGTIACYCRYTMCSVSVIREKEYDDYQSSVRGSILVTAVIVVIIILIYSWYKKAICLKSIKEGGKK